MMVVLRMMLMMNMMGWWGCWRWCQRGQSTCSQGRRGAGFPHSWGCRRILRCQSSTESTQKVALCRLKILSLIIFLNFWKNIISDNFSPFLDNKCDLHGMATRIVDEKMFRRIAMQIFTTINTSMKQTFTIMLMLKWGESDNENDEHFISTNLSFGCIVASLAGKLYLLAAKLYLLAGLAAFVNTSFKLQAVINQLFTLKLSNFWHWAPGQRYFQIWRFLRLKQCLPTGTDNLTNGDVPGSSGCYASLQ